MKLCGEFLSGCVCVRVRVCLLIRQVTGACGQDNITNICRSAMGIHTSGAADACHTGCTGTHCWPEASE